MSYIGRPVQKDGSYKKVDDFTFDGTTITFPITTDGGTRPVIPGSAPNLLLTVGGVTLEPDVDYAVSNDEITFTTAYAGGTAQFGRVLGDSYKAPASVPVNLDSLSDVVISAPATDHVLKYNGSQWVNDATVGVTHISNLDGVTITSPVSGQILTYNGTAWVNLANNFDITSKSISDLSDVVVDSSTTGYVLKWDGTNWNSDPILLNNIDEIATSGMVNGEVLTWNGSGWTNLPPQSAVNDIDDLGDVDTTTSAPATNDVLSWNGTDWIPVSLSGGSPHTLDSHTDVSTGATLGQILVWGGASWNPANPASGGGGDGTPVETGVQLHVAIAGNDATGDGSSGSPYATFKKAVDVANIKLTTDVIQILLKAGENHYADDDITIYNVFGSKILITRYDEGTPPIVRPFGQIGAVINAETKSVSFDNIDMYFRSSATEPFKFNGCDSVEFKDFNCVFLQPGTSLEYSLLKMIDCNYVLMDNADFSFEYNNITETYGINLENCNMHIKTSLNVENTYNAFVLYNSNVTSTVDGIITATNFNVALMSDSSDVKVYRFTCEGGDVSHNSPHLFNLSGHSKFFADICNSANSAKSPDLGSLSGASIAHFSNDVDTFFGNEQSHPITTGNPASISFIDDTHMSWIYCNNWVIAPDCYCASGAYPTALASEASPTSVDATSSDQNITDPYTSGEDSENCTCCRSYNILTTLDQLYNVTAIGGTLTGWGENPDINGNVLGAGSVELTTVCASRFCTLDIVLVSGSGESGESGSGEGES